MKAEMQCLACLLLIGLFLLCSHAINDKHLTAGVGRRFKRGNGDNEGDVPMYAPMPATSSPPLSPQIPAVDLLSAHGMPLAAAATVPPSNTTRRTEDKARGKRPKIAHQAAINVEKAGEWGSNSRDGDLNFLMSPELGEFQPPPASNPSSLYSGGSSAAGQLTGAWDSSADFFDQMDLLKHGTQYHGQQYPAVKSHSWADPFESIYHHENDPVSQELSSVAAVDASSSSQQQHPATVHNTGIGEKRRQSLSDNVDNEALQQQQQQQQQQQWMPNFEYHDDLAADGHADLVHQSFPGSTTMTGHGVQMVGDQQREQQLWEADDASFLQSPLLVNVPSEARDYSSHDGRHMEYGDSSLSFAAAGESSTASVLASNNVANQQQQAAPATTATADVEENEKTQILAQQQRVVDAYVHNNEKLRQVVEILKLLNEQGIRHGRKLVTLLGEDGIKTLTDALAYLGRAADGKLGQRAVVEGLGVGQANVSRVWSRRGITGVGGSGAARRRQWILKGEQEMQELLEAVEKQAKSDGGDLEDEPPPPPLMNDEELSRLLADMEKDDGLWNSLLFSNAAPAHPRHMDMRILNSMLISHFKRVNQQQQQQLQPASSSAQRFHSSSTAAGGGQPNFAQQKLREQMQLVERYVRGNDKLQAVVARLKERKGKNAGTTKQSQNLSEILTHEQLKTLNDAIVRLYKSASAGAIAQVLGIGQTKVRREVKRSQGLESKKTRKPSGADVEHNMHKLSHQEMVQQPQPSLTHSTDQTQKQQNQPLVQANLQAHQQQHLVPPQAQQQQHFPPPQAQQQHLVPPHNHPAQQQNIDPPHHHQAQQEHLSPHHMQLHHQHTHFLRPRSKLGKTIGRATTSGKQIQPHQQHALDEMTFDEQQEDSGNESNKEVL